MDQTKRTIVVTGGNRGIGYALVARLIKNPNFVVIFTSRNDETAKTAADTLIKENPSAQADSLHYHALDLAQKESISEFAEWVKNKFGKIDVLVNNAAIASNDPNMSDEIIRINYFNTREITERFLPLLSDDGKVINVSSIGGLLSTVPENVQAILRKSDIQDSDYDEVIAISKDFQKEAGSTGVSVKGYRIAKAILNSWTYQILPRSLKSTQQCYSLCPGAVITDMTSHTGTKTTDEGCDTIDYLINLPFEVNKELNGRFFEDRKVKDF